ncbi:sushi, von Willebrand factor type A, EGF and pentraxin domain-containing protein 1-like isoform X2 [Acanthaster planci]|uniref:Pentraxin family member n=1 Tax=Acanthaster planci TaxID=133434 RepID=A0A8B7YIZ8_ACAPL|nr:sushi, von Willebrand factor type A, EGF and pentraxin domain-containing protein 1-like isoform X2 [Acanthaster planci]
MSQEFLLDFTNSRTSEFSLLRTRHSEFQEITLSMWLRTTDSTNMGTPISYAAMKPADNAASGSSPGSLVDNTLTVTDCASLRIYVNGVTIFTDVAINNGRWTSLVFTWRGGEWHLYVNGTEANSGATLRTEAIPGQGVFVLGQEQDSIGGAFNTRETYLGEIYKLNIWDHVLPEDAIQALAHSCHRERGNVVAWPDFLAGLQGDLQPKGSPIDMEIPSCEEHTPDHRYNK